jgi:putative tryptophan/tyrosine transport system substrate-binding protein
MFGMRRREFISLIGGAATWPLLGPFLAYAQQSQRMPRVGLLMPYAENDPETSPRVAALRQGLQQLGWAEGRNVRLEHYQARMPTRCASSQENSWVRDRMCS